MIFKTHVAGVPCRCQVTHHLPGTRDRTSGAMEDAEEGSNEEFTFNLLDMNNNRAEWLESKVTDADYDRLLEEFHVTILEEKHCVFEIHSIH